MRSTIDIIIDIGLYTPVDGDWLGLDALLEELFESREPENFARELLAVFERFPDEDGAGVFWRILHALEHYDRYEAELVESLKRQPSMLGIDMLTRIANTGTRKIAGIQINELIKDILSNEKLSSSNRDYLLYFEEMKK